MTNIGLPLALLLILAVAVAGAVLWPGREDVDVDAERIFDPWGHEGRKDDEQR